MGTLDVLRDALARFRIDPVAVRLIRKGNLNRHWRVSDGKREYALRRYDVPPHMPHVRTREGIAFEHEALRHAAARGWPVAEPLRDARGDALVDAGGALFAVFPWLEGRPVTANSLRYGRIKGRLLARLHADFDRFGDGVQRPGFGRIWERDRYLGSPYTFNEALRELGRAHPEDAAIVRSQRYRSLRELARGGYGELRERFVHFDFQHDNLLFSGGTLTGLLDFDSAHLDARVVDVVNSIALDCLEAPAYDTISPERARAFVGGYVEGAALSEQELMLIVPLLRAWIVGAAAGRIFQWLAKPGDRVLAKIRRNTNGRFPAFERRRQALEAAVRDAALGGVT